jgi:hypothetical protein
MAEHDAGGYDAAEQDPLGVRMLQRAEEVAGERVHCGDQPRATLRGMLEALTVDPVAHPVRHLTHHAHVVHMANGGVIELCQRLGLAKEPGARRVIGIDVDADAHAPIEHAIDADEQDPFPVGRHDALETIARTQRHLGPREILGLRGHAGSALAAAAALHPHAPAAVIRAAPAAILGRRAIQQEERAGRALTDTDRDGGEGERLRGHARQCRQDPGWVGGREGYLPLARHAHQLLGTGYGRRAAR